MFISDLYLHSKETTLLGAASLSLVHRDPAPGVTRVAWPGLLVQSSCLTALPRCQEETSQWAGGGRVNNCPKTFLPVPHNAGVSLPRFLKKCVYD